MTLLLGYAHYSSVRQITLIGEVSCGAGTTNGRAQPASVHFVVATLFVAFWLVVYLRVFPAALFNTDAILLKPVAWTFGDTFFSVYQRFDTLRSAVVHADELGDDGATRHARAINPVVWALNNAL